MADIIQSTAAEIPFWLPDSSTSGTSGLVNQTFSGAEIQICKPGGAWANFAGSVAEAGGAGNGQGLYWLTLTTSETNLSLASGSIGKLVVKVNKVGAVANRIYEYTVSSLGVGDLTTAAKTSLISALGATLHNGVHSVFGTMRRMEAFLTGKRTGQKTTTVTVYQPDGTTVAYTVTRDVATADASAASITSGQE